MQVQLYVPPDSDLDFTGYPKVGPDHLKFRLHSIFQLHFPTVNYMIYLPSEFIVVDVYTCDMDPPRECASIEFDSKSSGYLTIGVTWLST